MVRLKKICDMYGLHAMLIAKNIQDKKHYK